MLPKTQEMLYVKGTKFIEWQKLTKHLLITVFKKLFVVQSKPCFWHKVLHLFLPESGLQLCRFRRSFFTSKTLYRG